MATIFPPYSGPPINRFVEEFQFEEIILNKILAGKTFEFSFSADKQTVRIDFPDNNYFTLTTVDFFKLLIIVVKLVGLNSGKPKKVKYPDFLDDSII